MHKPTIGTIVHFYAGDPAAYPLMREGNIPFAAMVIGVPEESERILDLSNFTIDLSIFTLNQHTPLVIKEGVSHKGMKSWVEGSPYWDWPPII